MKHYEITVENGNYPLTYKCSTIAEAYGCMESLKCGLLRDTAINLDLLMEQLVDMKNGQLLSTVAHRYSISVQDGEV